MARFPASRGHRLHGYRRGYYDGYALRADGSIVAWGNDSSGEVSGVPAGSGYKAIAAGPSTGYALKADGSIVAWGADYLGEVSDVPAGSGYTAIAGVMALAMR